MTIARFMVFILLAVLTAIPASTARAHSGPVEIHGFGGWSYNRSNTSENRYLSSSKEGEAGYANMALAFSARTSNHFRVNAQVWWEQCLDEEWTTVIDYAFGEWRYSDALKLRAGQVKHPFGIYTEVFDVGTLRPFFWLPQSLYGPAGIVSESYRGAGLTGSLLPSGEWSVDYDLYGGEMAIESPNFASIYAAAIDDDDDGEASEEAEEEVELRDLVGCRVTVTMPGSAFRLGVSSYAGKEGGGEQEWHSVVGGHAEYLALRWQIRGECVYRVESPAVDAVAAYVEAAGRLHGPWQVAARADYSKTRLDGEVEESASSLRDHRDLSLGLNYWFSSDFVIKLSTSWIEGNRFARPENIRAAIEGEGLSRESRLVTLGAQFAF